MSDRDNHIAHKLISEHADHEDMGRLRSAFAEALATARQEAVADAIKQERKRIREAIVALQEYIIPFGEMLTGYRKGDVLAAIDAAGEGEEDGTT